VTNIKKVKEIFKIVIAVILLIQLDSIYAQGTLVGTGTLEKSALIQVESNGKGVLLPKLTTVERDVILIPAEGLMIYNTDINCIEVYDGAFWQPNCSCESYAGKAEVNPINADFCNEDSITLSLDSAKGAVQWQFSKDNNRFYDILGVIGSGAKTPALGCNTYYRAKVNDGNCPAVYSDTLGVPTLPADNWKKITSMPSGRQQAYAFSIFNKGYVMGGYLASGRSEQLFEYNPQTNSWSQKANMPQKALGGSSFVLYNKGYIVGGISGIGQQLWQYDPITNIWTIKSNFPGSERFWNIAFSINNVGYSVGGASDKVDFYAYYPLNDKWVQMADFPGTSCESGAATTFQGKAYVFPGGYQGSGKQLWEYDPSNLSWALKGDIPFLAAASGNNFMGSFLFTICDYVYFGSRFNDFWRYDPITQVWTRMADLPEVRRLTVGFVLNNKGYYGSGEKGSSSSSWYSKEFWEYCP
jgi:hypothetical protein